MLGNIEGRRRGWQRMRGWMASPIQWTWTWTNWELVKNRGGWCAAVLRVAKSWTWLSNNIYQVAPGKVSAHLWVGPRTEKILADAGCGINIPTTYSIQAGRFYGYRGTYAGKRGCIPLKHSVQFSHSVVSDSLPPHGLQRSRPLCPSPAPRVYPNSCPLSQWCHPTISSFVVPFSSCLQSFPASGVFPMNQFFASGGQSIGASASTSVLPMNIQDWFPLGWTKPVVILWQAPKGESQKPRVLEHGHILPAAKTNGCQHASVP